MWFFILVFSGFFVESFAQLGPGLDTLPLYRTRMLLDFHSNWTDEVSLLPQRTMTFRYSQSLSEKLPALVIADVMFQADITDSNQHMLGLAMTYRYEQKPMFANLGVSIAGDRVRLSEDEWVSQAVVGLGQTIKNSMFALHVYLPDQKVVEDKGDQVKLLPGFDLGLQVWQPLLSKNTLHTTYAYSYFKDSNDAPFHGPKFTLGLEKDSQGYNAALSWATHYDNLHGAGMDISMSYTFFPTKQPVLFMPFVDSLDHPAWRNRSFMIYTLPSQG